MVHRRSAQSSPTKAAEVLGAHVSLMSEFVQSPITTNISGDPFPEVPEAVVLLPRLGKTLHIAVNDFDPVVHDSGFGVAGGLLDQTFDGIPEGLAVKGGHKG
jgi:hypothetical protein